MNDKIDTSYEDVESKTLRQKMKIKMNVNLSESANFAFADSTTRPEKCDFFAQSYQSQPITATFQKCC